MQYVDLHVRGGCQKQFHAQFTIALVCMSVYISEHVLLQWFCSAICTVNFS
jgi:hypothetical protein